MAFEALKRAKAESVATCGSCLFSEEVSDRRVSCHRFPDTDRSNRDIWDWCGEFQPSYFEDEDND